MFRFRFEDVPIEMAPVEVAWANMREADTHFNLVLFVVAANGWLNAHGGTKNFQDLERELRVSGFETHIIAAPQTLTGVDLRLPYDCAEDTRGATHWKYESWFSCRPRNAAMEELLTFSESYEANFAKLLITGCSTCKKANDPIVPPEGHSIQRFDGKEGDDFDRVNKNTAIVKIARLDAESALAELRQTYPDVELRLINETEKYSVSVFVSETAGGFVGGIGVVTQHGDDDTGESTVVRLTLK
jgi:hypothetical protein